jgi:cofilin
MSFDDIPKAKSFAMATLHGDCSLRYRELQHYRSKWKFIIFRLSEDEREIVVEHAGPRTATFEDFEGYFPTNDIRWAVYDVRYQTLSGAQRSRVVFITWVPDTIQRDTFRESARVKSNGLTHSHPLKSSFEGVACSIQANAPGDLTLSGFLERASRTDREPADPSSVL